MAHPKAIVLCPGQGAQKVGMGRAWFDESPAARAVFEEADAVLGVALGAPLSALCFEGPAGRLHQTDVSQAAIYTCSVACLRGMADHGAPLDVAATAGLSLGEYTALHLAGVFDFATGLRLVAERGRLMQAAADASDGGMVALIGADEAQADAVCSRALEAAPDEVLVPANFNAPGQIVLSGHARACARAVEAAAGLDLKATPLTVAGAFHSPLMQPAADRMAEVLAAAVLAPARIPVWSNVTAEPHDPGDPELLRLRLVEQIVSPVEWARSCSALGALGTMDYHELAPGNVLRGLMRRINREIKVITHDLPTQPQRA